MNATKQSLKSLRRSILLQAATGAILIPPYNDPHIISGQGTMALELLEQVSCTSCGMLYDVQLQLISYVVCSRSHLSLADDSTRHLQVFEQCIAIHASSGTC